MYISSDFRRNSERANTVQKKCAFCGSTKISSEKYFKRIRWEKENARAAGDSDNRGTERTPQRCFRCGFEDHLMEIFLKSPKENDKRKKQVHLNEKGNHACDYSKNNVDQNLYASMACMSDKTNVLVEIR